MNGVQTRFKCKLDVKRCKRFVFPPSSLLPRSNALKTKAIRYFQTDRTLTRIVSPPLHPHVTTLQEDIYEAQAIENKLKGIILFFSIVSLLITLLGVYSTITLDTERRQKEVAIRKVNGAGLKQIILLFARLYIKLLTVSAIIAFPLIYIVIQIWKKAYIVFFNDGIIYWAGIFIGITFITALTVLFRILGIARINPAKVIKNE